MTSDITGGKQMGESVHERMYEKGMEMLEAIVDEDPDYEDQSDAEFIEEFVISRPGGFTTKEVKRIERIYGKYCRGDRTEDK